MYYWNSYVSPPTPARLTGSNATWSMRVGLAPPSNPLGPAKTLRDQAVKADSAATSAQNAALNSHDSAAISLALKQNADAISAWQAVQTEVTADLSVVNLYSHTPGADMAIVAQWKSEAKLLTVTADLRLAALGADHTSLLALHPDPGGFQLPPGALVPPPPPAEAPKSEWDTVAGNAAIVALVSAVVYTGWKLLAKGAA